MGVQKHYIGETFTAYNGMKFTIINIDRTLKKPFTIQFEDGYITDINGTFLKNGATIKNNNLDRKKNRLGEQRRHKDGSLMTIIEYTKADNILVRFDDSSICRTKYYNFANGTCIHKIRLFGVDYDSVMDVCKHFKLNKHTLAGKSRTEIEKYIANNRIEHNGQWMSITNYITAYKVTPDNFYKYLRVNGIEKNPANVKKYIARYLETTENKMDVVPSKEDTLKIINNYFGTSFESLNDFINQLDLGYKNLCTLAENREVLIKYIKKHYIQYGGQWISIKSYCEKLGIEYDSLKAWTKTRHIRINTSNITEAIKSYRDGINLEVEKQKVYEMQKLENLIKIYIKTIDAKSRTRVTSEFYSYFNHNNVSAEQVIVHFRPDLHINIFGKIVDENGNEV